MRFIIIILVGIIICGIVVLCEIIRENHFFVTKMYDVTVPGTKWKETHNIVFLSDLHNHVYGNDNDILLEHIRRLKPECVLIGGDLLVAKPGADFSVAVKLLEQLCKEHKVFYAPGNHEHRLRLYPEVYQDMAKRYEKALQHLPIHWLINESATIDVEDTKIHIFGIEIDKEFYNKFSHEILSKEDVEALLGRKPKAYTMLLAHNPEYFKAYAGWGADVTLSGHVHGGIMRLPFLGGVISPSLRIFPKYDGGRKREFGKEMIISRGLGVHTIPIRLFNPAELVVLRLGSEE